jgi:hypothetical protein
MRFKGSSTLLLLGAFILLAGLLAGCGGGEGQAGNNESQNGGAPGGETEQGGAAQGGATQGGATQGGGPQVKTALGTIATVVPDRRKIILRPSTEVQDGERMKFKVQDDAEITLNDEPAEMTDIEEGQKAQIQYVVRNGRNRATDVGLISEGEGTGS